MNQNVRELVKTQAEKSGNGLISFRGFSEALKSQVTRHDRKALRKAGSLLADMVSHVGSLRYYRLNPAYSSQEGQLAGATEALHS